VDRLVIRPLKIINKLLGRASRRQFTAEPLPPAFAELLETEREAWEEAVERAKPGPEVLLATSVGGNYPIREMDSLLAMALTLAGARVSILLCDGALPACEQCVRQNYPSAEEFIKIGPGRTCETCFGGAEARFEALGLEVLRYSQFITNRQRRDAADKAERFTRDQMAFYVEDGVAIGEHALAGTLRFYARGDLSTEPTAEAALRRYFQAALLTHAALKRLFTERKFVCASFHHGIYVPQGIVGETARRLGVRVANWVVAYRKRRFVFSHGDTYHHTLLDEPVAAWENVDFTDDARARTEAYLHSRRSGSQDWIYFHENPEEGAEAVRKEVGLSADRPAVLMLTNVIWDAQLHYRANAFPSMLDWIEETIRYFIKRPEMDLVVRVHPAELRGGIPSRQRVADEIARLFPTLPKNIIIIGPERNISTYAIAEQCNAAIIYGTKTGVELSGMGIPVVVAGEAWIRNKGLTRDASSAEGYYKILDELPFAERLDEATRAKALKYAFHFFFRRMIPVSSITPVKGENTPFRAGARTLAEISPENDPGLATICRGIIEGAPFIYPAEDLLDEEDLSKAAAAP